MSVIDRTTSWALIFVVRGWCFFMLLGVLFLCFSQRKANCAYSRDCYGEWSSAVFTGLWWYYEACTCQSVIRRWCTAGAWLDQGNQWLEYLGLISLRAECGYGSVGRRNSTIILRLRLSNVQYIARAGARLSVVID